MAHSFYTPSPTKLKVQELLEWVRERMCVYVCVLCGHVFRKKRENTHGCDYNIRRGKKKVIWDLVSEGGIFRLAAFIALCKLGLIWLHAVETWLAGGEMGPSRWTIMGLLVTTRLLQLPFPMDLHWGPKPRAPKNKWIRLAFMSLTSEISKYTYVHTYTRTHL